jgi:hypothetical protein
MASGKIGQLEVYAVVRSFYGGEMPTTRVRIRRGVIWRQLFNLFSREYEPPEKFPTPRQVAEADFVSLRSAGLSTRKAEYSTPCSIHNRMETTDYAKFKTLLSTLLTAAWTQTRYGMRQ